MILSMNAIQGCIVLSLGPAAILLGLCVPADDSHRYNCSVHAAAVNIWGGALLILLRAQVARKNSGRRHYYEYIPSAVLLPRYHAKPCRAACRYSPPPPRVFASVLESIPNF